MTTMVLPAPVSPVMTVRPGPNSRVDASITPKPEMLISSSIVRNSDPTSSLGGAAPPFNG